MSFLNVNKNTCTSCGACVSVCPVGILAMAPATKLPVPVEGASEFCIRCGHCVAVCPFGALSLDTMPVEDCSALPEGWQLTPEQVALLLKGRRSVRRYQAAQVAREVIEQIVDTARHAPSGINLQPVRYAVVHQAESMAALKAGVLGWARGLVEQGDPLAQKLNLQRAIALAEKGEDYLCRNAPHLVFAYGVKENMTAPQACTIAATFLELAAVSHGLGACWAGYVMMAVNMVPELKRSVGIPRQCDCYAALLIGYPQHPYPRIPIRKRARVVWK